jgi:hypothetical protein
VRICHSRTVCRTFVSKNYPIYLAEEWRQVCGLRRCYRTEIVVLRDSYWDSLLHQWWLLLWARNSRRVGLFEQLFACNAKTSVWITTLQEPLVELLHCMNLCLNYSIAETSGWITPLREPLVELHHCKKHCLNYSIEGTSAWITQLQETLSYSIAGISGWIIPLQEPLFELLHCRNLWLNYSLTRA